MQYQIQVKYKTSIPDNIKHWQLFDDDEQLKSFLQAIDEFVVLQIEEEQLDNNGLNKENQTSQLESRIGDHNIIQLSNSFIPKGLVPLENCLTTMMFLNIHYQIHLKKI